MSVFLKDKFKFILTFVFLFSFINTSYWMIKNHPHQYVYFNFLAGKDFNKKFEMDYWGLSYKENIEFLLDYHKAGKINLFNLSHNKLYYSLMGFNEKQKSRINVVKYPEDADYFMTNYYYINPKNVRYKLYSTNISPVYIMGNTSYFIYYCNKGIIIYECIYFWIYIKFYNGSNICYYKQKRNNYDKFK